ncbi:Lateral organ boundaries LOB [Arabidopsis thaliana x Arabidopsis arenosa]|uniref:Lateral organ boundaries LOB n=1 Tax=Arabidopsis thaliana x Arabidopsis arenosa TaxID=1240361 RepID=A0A8T1ZKP6_9BRAS|nr:Lateral organ boundaries LOB [Arabidopsis thaliana x Arabidopsis arenosa]
MNPNSCRFCRLQNKKCANDCMFSPLFPSNNLRKFTIMNFVFGHKTLTFFLKDLSSMDRKYTTRTLYFEAKSWLFGPSKDPSDFLNAVINYANQTPAKLSKTKKLLASYSRPTVVLALPAPRFLRSKTKSSDGHR